MKTLKDIFVSKEIAKKLKGIGFSEPCIAYYLDSETYKRLYVTNVETDGSFTALGDTLVIGNHNNEDDLISAPTYEQVFRWFRSKGLNSYIFDNFDKLYFFFIKNKNVEIYRSNWEETSSKYFETYEEAQEQLILKLIEIYEQKH